MVVEVRIDRMSKSSAYRTRCALSPVAWQYIAANTRDKRDLPRYTQQLPSHPVPTTPESPSALVRLPRRWQRPSPPDHRVGTLKYKLRGSMGSLVVRPASLRFLLC